MWHVLEAMGRDWAAMSEAEASAALSQLSERLAVAVAPDALAATKDIGPDDFQVCWCLCLCCVFFVCACTLRPFPLSPKKQNPNKQNNIR